MYKVHGFWFDFVYLAKFKYRTYIVRDNTAKSRTYFHQYIYVTTRWRKLLNVQGGKHTITTCHIRHNNPVTVDNLQTELCKVIWINDSKLSIACPFAVTLTLYCQQMFFLFCCVGKLTSAICVAMFMADFLHLVVLTGFKKRHAWNRGLHYLQYQISITRRSILFTHSQSPWYRSW